jgi:hypothetical protein
MMCNCLIFETCLRFVDAKLSAKKLMVGCSDLCAVAIGGMMCYYLSKDYALPGAILHTLREQPI